MARGLCLGVLGLALLVPDTAQAVYECGGVTDDCQCGANNTYPCCSNDGNCTWYAWHRACCEWSLAIGHWGDAKQWAPGAAADPLHDVVSSPVINSIACRSVGTWGHVAWVTGISGSNTTVDEMNCDWGPGGVQVATRATSYYDQGFIVLAGCQCSTGDTQVQDCGDYCGTQTRDCDGCNWNSWSACQNEGVCIAGTTETEDCGDHCGTQTRTCDGSCQWGSFGACENEGECIAGNTETQACPTCDFQTRDCQTDCTWAAWSTCPDPSDCRDAAMPGPDSSVGPGPDGSQPPSDAHIQPGSDASTPGADGGGTPQDLFPHVVGGCDCNTGSGPGPLSLPLLILLAMGYSARRHRIR